MLNERHDDLPEHPLQHEVNIQTPGAILMAEREAQGIELSEVAAKLKLSRQWLERIEADIFDRDAFVYLRGYIRSYAQLLGLKVEAVLAALDHAYKPHLEKEAERTVLAPQPVVAQVRSHRSTRRMIRMGSIAVALIIFLSVILWWFDQRPASNTAMPASMSLPADSSQDIPMPAATASANASKVTNTVAAPIESSEVANTTTTNTAAATPATPVTQAVATQASVMKQTTLNKPTPAKQALPSLPAPSSDFTITKVTN